MAAKPFHPFFGTFLLLFVLQPFVIKSLQFESLQNIQQAEKGDIINGVNQIKKYLKTYGYYPNEIKHVLDNQFDESLESALKAYQKYNFLNVTGKIDSDTIKAMMIPRCGVPDNYLVSNYNLTKYKWRKYNLLYSIKNGVNVFTEAQLTPVFEKAFKSWATISPFKFGKAPKNYRADIMIGFFQSNHGDNSPFVPKTWAHAYPPPIGKVHFNANATKKWSFNPGEKQVDVQSIAVHEFGHALGLDHSGLKSAVMYPYFQGGNYTKRDLTKDDKDGLKALYRY